ncbi:putative phage tail protein [Acetobacter pasteurianus]|uniref:putative phage tail protein n=1 Tax=Acetobacter pasteurianus TaxID=438 RepID=UPI0003842672|nr:putative phage tail protein [Acetobacter pasteurianus]CCT58500.1 hypothetical protein APA386B_382 [Acetobacter pasteurianus 386B]
MSAPIFSVENFRSAVLSLLPRGPIWSRSVDGVLYKLAGIWAQTFQRNGERSANLLSDAFPATTEELLPEWQKTLGLPDVVQTTTPTLVQAQGQVMARLCGDQSISIPALEALAKTLGYSAIVTPCSAFYFGMPFGSSFGGEEWNFVYIITVDSPGTDDHTVFEYEMRRASQAGTTIYFEYTG